MENVIEFYSRPEIQQAIIENARGREVAVKFGDRGFGKRPDMLRYPGDVAELAAQGATSFHISEERWSNPLAIQTGSERKVLDDLRIGWDLIIDIDSPEIEFSKLTTYFVIEWLKRFGIRSISCKFSGNKGFHVGVPFEAFPAKISGQETCKLFPEVPRRVAGFMIEQIKWPLAKKILETSDGDLNTIAKKAGFDTKEEITVVKDGVRSVNIEAFLEVDTVLLSSRHLYRSVYSFNEKSGLVSIPIDPEKVMEFQKPMADPKGYTPSHLIFLDPIDSNSSECLSLFTETLDFKPELAEEVEAPKYKDFEALEHAIPLEHFPPCMLSILSGLKDGKKRALFALVNFLMSCGWKHEEIEILVKEWNTKNPEKLRENIIIGQLRYRKNRKAMLPPNCVNTTYKDIGICHPDNLCGMVKNPVQYAKRKGKFGNNKTEKKKDKKINS
jgi:DNA primase catalytic subunit